MLSSETHSPEPSRLSGIDLHRRSSAAAALGNCSQDNLGHLPSLAPADAHERVSIHEISWTSLGVRVAQRNVVPEPIQPVLSAAFDPPLIKAPDMRVIKLPKCVVSWSTGCPRALRNDDGCSSSGSVN